MTIAHLLSALIIIHQSIFIPRLDAQRPGIHTADLTINDRQRKTIMQANKDGFYYVLDRVSGAKRALIETVQGLL